MSNSTVTASVTFIDLATFGELEGFTYGGPNAITWFVASVQKANWFSHVPISLRNIGTNAQFGAMKASYSLSRQGDYVLNSFLRAKWPAIGFKSNIISATCNGSIRYVDNLMHNLIRHVQIEFNDLVVQEFDNYWLDDNFEWRCVGQKRQGYRNMIGDISTYQGPGGVGVGPGNFVGGTFLSLPLPFFYGEDSGIALPVAALPFNDVKITYDFRDWKELIMINPGTLGQLPTVADVCTYVNGAAQDAQQPALSNVETFATYAIVHNDERVKMGDAPRDILIHQIQETQVAPFKDVTSRSSFDIRLSHAIVLFTFKAQNISLQNFFSGQYGYDQSNYTTLCTMVPGVGSDPISFTHLFYENSVRLASYSDFFSLTHPWYFSDAIAEKTGYHMYSYALKPWDPTRPSASTDYSKLANVSVAHDASQAAINAASGLYEDGTTIHWPAPGSAAFLQTFQHVFIARNWNIFRAANGSAGFPAL
jgi:hypothetical protein